METTTLPRVRNLMSEAQMPPAPPPAAPPPPRGTPWGWRDSLTLLNTLIGVGVLTVIYSAGRWVGTVETQLKDGAKKQDIVELKSSVVNRFDCLQNAIRNMGHSITGKELSSLERNLGRDLGQCNERLIVAGLRRSFLRPVSNFEIFRQSQGFVFPVFQTSSIYSVASGTVLSIGDAPRHSLALRIDSLSEAVERVIGSDPSSLLALPLQGSPAGNTITAVYENAEFTVKQNDHLIEGQTIGKIQVAPLTVGKLVLSFFLNGKPLPPADDFPELALGREIYVTRCAACHDPEGQRGQLVGPDLLRFKTLSDGRPPTDESLKKQIAHHRLKGMTGEPSLSTEEKQAVINYLLGRAADLQRP